MDFLKFFGPAWITMIADMDAASIITAAQTGISFKYSLIWFLAILTIPLFFIQEVSGRIGAVTKKGLGEIIREYYSRNIALLMVVPMIITDVLSYAAEYAGIAIGLTLLGIPIAIGLPLVFVFHIGLVYRRKYVEVEKALMFVSLVLIASFFIGLVKVGIRQYPIFQGIGGPNINLLFLLAANAGAVVMPFMLFYQASATAEKSEEPLWVSRLETLIGAIVTEVLMIVVEMVAAPLPSGTDFMSAESLKNILYSVTGPYSSSIFGLGLISAAFLALVVISLSSAWGLMEALGLRRSQGFAVYVVESLPALIVPFIFKNLVSYILNLMVVFVFALIGPAFIMGIIAQDERIMGHNKLSKGWKVAYWSSVFFVLAFGFLSLAYML
ncbi:MAG: divalent metal cation transporter [Sulfolobaceae archaeon]|nr:divalent metal cation transporter [Sulfolobaceae archaeon]